MQILSNFDLKELQNLNLKYALKDNGKVSFATEIFQNVLEQFMP